MKRNHTIKFSKREIRIINKRNERYINRNLDIDLKWIKRYKPKNINNIPISNNVSIKKPNKKQ